MMHGPPRRVSNERETARASPFSRNGLGAMPPGAAWHRSCCARGMHLRSGLPCSLLQSRRVRALACQCPPLFSGEQLHRAGLHAFAGGEHETAVRLLERAALRYRRDLRTEALARVRVHQLMAAACAAGGRVSPLSLEVDRALTRLERIESPVPPFPMVAAHVLLASWLSGSEAEDGAGWRGADEPQRLAA